MSAPIAKVAGVAGWPIHHSLSPLLHTFWLRNLGISGAYIPFAVRPDEALYAFKTLKRTSIAGLNVTLPLKGIAARAADSLTPDAEKLGVVNCLYVRGGELIGHNTDMEGFTAPLLDRVSITNLVNRPAVLIGAGGASRAVIGALLAIGVQEIRLLNRTDQKAIDMAEIIAIPSLYARSWVDRDRALAGAGLIINASAGGMSGKPALDISLDLADADALVYDLIYTPLITPLMRSAQRRGLQTLGGLEMLIAQARPSFKAFYGVLPPSHTIADPRPVLLQRLSEPRNDSPRLSP
ncbi:MAG: shikimate dehydrogenase [Robiginitomaculum sp.]